MYYMCGEEVAEMDINITEEEINIMIRDIESKTIKCNSCFHGHSSLMLDGVKKLNDFSRLKTKRCSKCKGQGHITPCKSMNITLIAAVARNNAIGKNNDLLWKIPEDLKFFKEKTTNKTIVMGRKTYESIGKLLPNRKNVIITNKDNYSVEGATIINNIDEFFLNIENTGEEIMVIGGGEIYKKTIPYANKMYLTEVIDKPDGDVFFPTFSLEDWQIISKDVRDGSPEYSFCIYARIK